MKNKILLYLTLMALANFIITNSMLSGAARELSSWSGVYLKSSLVVLMSLMYFANVSNGQLADKASKCVFLAVMIFIAVIAFSM